MSAGIRGSRPGGSWSCRSRPRSRAPCPCQYARPTRACRGRPRRGHTSPRSWPRSAPHSPVAAPAASGGPGTGWPPRFFPFFSSPLFSRVSPTATSLCQVPSSRGSRHRGPSVALGRRVSSHSALVHPRRSTGSLTATPHPDCAIMTWCAGERTPTVCAVPLLLRPDSCPKRQRPGRRLAAFAGDAAFAHARLVGILRCRVVVRLPPLGRPRPRKVGCRWGVTARGWCPRTRSWTELGESSKDNRHRRCG